MEVEAGKCIAQEHNKLVKKGFHHFDQYDVNLVLISEKHDIHS